MLIIFFLFYSKQYKLKQSDLCIYDIQVNGSVVKLMIKSKDHIPFEAILSEVQHNLKNALCVWQLYRMKNIYYTIKLDWRADFLQAVVSLVNSHRKLHPNEYEVYNHYILDLYNKKLKESKCIPTSDKQKFIINLFTKHHIKFNIQCDINYNLYDKWPQKFSLYIYINCEILI